MKQNACQNREAKKVHGRGIKSEARRRKDRDGNVGETTRGLRDEAEKAGMVPWPEEGYIGEVPHPIYDKDDAFKI